MNLYVIYGLYCVCDSCGDKKEIRYVGQTRVGVIQRLRVHLTPFSLQTETFPVSRWKAKHGKDNIRITELEVCTKPEDLNDREVFWIERFGTLTTSGKGLNLSPGGGQKTVVSPELRARLKERFSGENAPGAKLTWASVNELRTGYPLGLDVGEWAQRNNVRKEHAFRILRGERWEDPDYEYTPLPRKTGDDNHRTLVDHKTALEIRDRRRDTGDSTSRIAKEYGLSKSTVYAICSGRRSGIDPA